MRLIFSVAKIHNSHHIRKNIQRKARFIQRKDNHRKENPPVRSRNKKNKKINDYLQLRDNALKGQKHLARGNALW